MSDNFHINDFTEENYKSILRYCSEKFEIIHYSDLPAKKKGLIWRHDIDLSVHRSFKLAVMEREAGIKATYFIHLHSEYYSVMEKKVFALISEIISLGHSIGLHFDPGFYGDKIKDEAALERYIGEEKDLLENMFETKLSTFSFHNPDVGDFLKYDEFIYAGLKNTYAKFFKEQIKYCSDSNGYWRFKRLQDFLEECSSDDLVQVLTHPEWWTPEAMLPRERVLRCINGRASGLITAYDSYFQDNELRKNIGSK